MLPRHIDAILTVVVSCGGVACLIGAFVVRVAPLIAPAVNAISTLTQ